MSGIDWNAVKNDYVTGSMSYRALAGKHHISSSSNISRHGRREGWPALREKYQTELAAQYARLAAEKTAAENAALAGEMQEKIDEFIRKLAQKVEETLNYGEAFSPRDLMNLTGALSRLQENVNAFRSFGQSLENREIIVQFVGGEWENEGS